MVEGIGDMTADAIHGILRSLPGVADVSVRAYRGCYTAHVYLSHSDRATRRQVYAAEGYLADNFPDTGIEVNLIYTSASGHDNPILAD
jgi:hypothetical protein